MAPLPGSSVGFAGQFFPLILNSVEGRAERTARQSLQNPLGAILSVKQTGLGRVGLQDLIDKYR